MTGATGFSITRRHIIAGLALTASSLAVSRNPWANSDSQSMPEKSNPQANQSRTSLHQEVPFTATAARIYELLLDSKQFAACTGLPAKIDPKVGGAFSTFGGLIVGRNVELLPNQRIVQAWRPTHWDAGVYSIVKFELKPQGSATLIVLDHTGFPEGDFDSLSSGWKERYWDPMKKSLA